MRYRFEIERTFERPYLLLEGTYPEPEILNYLSVKHAGTLSVYLDDNVEYFRVISRSPQADWSKARLEKDRLSANFQGNPLWPQLILEPFTHLSDYFGLSDSSTEHTCIIPLPETIHQKMEGLSHLRLAKNQKNFGFQKINLYRKNSAGKISDPVYVDTFIDTGKLPIAEILDRDSVHDWSYHFFTFFFDEFLENIRLSLEVIRSQIQNFKGTTCYPWNYYGHRLDEQGRMQGTPLREELPYVDAIYRQMAVSLDVSTAKLVQLFMVLKKGMIEKCHGERQWCEAFFQGVTLSTLQKLLPLETNLDQKIQIPSNLGIPIQGTLIDYCLNKLRTLDAGIASEIVPEHVHYRRKAFQTSLQDGST